MMCKKESTYLTLLFLLCSLTGTCSDALETTQRLSSTASKLRGFNKKSLLKESNSSSSIPDNYRNLENQKRIEPKRSHYLLAVTETSSSIIRQLALWGQSKENNNNDGNEDGVGVVRDGSTSSYGQGGTTSSHTYGESEDGYQTSREKPPSTSGYGGYSSNKSNGYSTSSHSTGNNSHNGYTTGNSSHNGYTTGSNSHNGYSSGSSSSYGSSYGSSGSSSSGYKREHDDDDKKSSWSWPWSKKESSSSSSSYGSGSSYEKKKQFKAPKVPLPWVLFLILTFVPIGMIATAHQFEDNPEGQYANFCRLSLTTVGCICKIMYNLYHCRLGDIPSVVCAEDDDEDYTDEDLERMKLRPGIERALDVEHRKSLRKTTKELSSKQKKKQNDSNQQKKKLFSNIQAGPGLTGAKRVPPPKQTAGTVATKIVGNVAKGALNSITNNNRSNK